MLWSFDLEYHPGKANVVADALSRKTRASLSFLIAQDWEVVSLLNEFGLNLIDSEEQTFLFTLDVQPTLITRILEAQSSDPESLSYQTKVGSHEDWSIRADKGLCYKNRLYVPKDIRQDILQQAHSSRLAVHPGSTKMYHNVARQYWWPGMKRDIAEYVSRCLICQQVKVEHRKPGGLLQPLPVPGWKWERITMDFVVGLPKSQKGNDAIWVIVDRLTKSSHFIPIRTTDSIEKLCRVYIDQIVRLHGVHISIVSDRDPRFVSRYWSGLQKALGTQLSLSTAFHPQTDGQSERTIQVLEDMLRACVLDFGGSWESHLSLIEFAYNNSYHSSIGMAPFEALYGRPCRSPICWLEVGEKALLGPEMVQETTDNIQLIQKRLETARSRQKSYADLHRRDLEFGVGDQVFLKISPKRGILRFGKKGKLAPRYIGPFPIIDRIGEVAYKLQLPQQLAGIHPVFHVSMLRKYIPDPTHAIEYKDLHVEEDGSYEVRPIQVLDRKDQVLRNKVIPLVKILWTHHGVEEATWEREDSMKATYPELFNGT